MASESELADLFITLRAVNTPMLEGFTQTAVAGEEMVTSLVAGLTEVDAALARTADQLAAMSAEMANVGASAAADAAAAGAAASGESAAAGAGVGAGATGAEADAAAAAAARIEAENQKLIDSAAKLAASADATALKWNDDYAKMSAATAKASLDFEAANAKAAASTEAMGAKIDAAGEQAGGSFASKLGISKTALVGVGAVAIGVGYESTKMAADFETSTTRLLTSGGEIQANIGMVRQGMLDMAGQVGVSAEQLAQHMYTVESAGYHGAEGLGVLKAAEQGAKAEGADASTVADALSSAMRDYYPNAKGAADVTADATDVMSKFVGATSTGKMSFQDLASSLHSVLPAASAAHVGLNDILGALAAMTVHGMSADQASQNLAHAIGHLQTITAPQGKELALLGINARQLSDDLGTKGLTGTVQEVADAIQKRMGPQATDVILNLQTALAKLPPEVQALGQQLLTGSISQGDFTKATKGLSVEAAGQASAFATLAKSTHTVGQDQKAGTDVMQSYSQALKSAMGDQTGMNVALMLTGQNTDYTNSAVKQISQSTADANGNVKGFAESQKTLNAKLVDAKGALGSLFIEIGQHLLPVFSSLAGAVASGANWLSQHKTIAAALAVVLGIVLAGAALTAIGMLGKLAFTMVTGPIKAFADGGKAVVGFATNLSGGLSGAESAAGTWGGRIGKIFSGVGSAAKSGFGVVVDAAKTVGSTVTGTVLPALSRFGSAAVDVAATVGTKVITGVRMLGVAIAETLWPALVEAAVATWSFTVALLANPVTWIVIGIIALVAAIILLITHWRQVESWLKGAWSGFLNWAKGIWSSLTQFFSGLLDKVRQAFVNGWNRVVAIVRGWYPLILGILTGGLLLLPALIFKYWSQIEGWFKNLWSRVVQGVSNFIGGLKQRWDTAVSDVQNWLSHMWSNLSSWWSGLPSRVVAWVENLVSGLRRKWDDAVSGVERWLSEMWSRISSWFSSLPGKIAGFFGDAGSWLLNAGRAILDGFLNGLKSAWSAVTNFIGGIGSWIADHKGPIEYDRTLLTPHGNAIMDGLLAGLQTGGQKVAGYLDNFTQSIASAGGAALDGTINVNGTMTAQAPVVGVGVGGSGGPTVINQVTVQVAGSVISENDLTRYIQTQMLRLSSRNGGFGTNAAFS